MRDLSYIKHILSVGCSYTKNSSEESDYREKSTKTTSFTKELAKKLNVPFNNLAVGGHSFHSLFFTFFEWIENNKELSKETLVVVGLTHFNRQNFWINDGTAHSISYHKSKNGSYDYLEEHLKYLSVSLEEYVTFQNVLYRHFNNTAKQQTAEIIYMKQIEQYCKDRNIPYIIVDIPGEGYRFDYLPKWHDVLDKVYTFPNGDKSWKQYISNYDKNFRLEHPNYEDHVILGNLLYEYINI